jgi:hypothetical protein
VVGLDTVLRGLDGAGSSGGSAWVACGRSRLPAARVRCLGRTMYQSVLTADEADRCQRMHTLACQDLVIKSIVASVPPVQSDSPLHDS